VDENVGCAVIRLNEAEALGCVEPLNGTCVHDDILFESLIEDCSPGKAQAAMKTDFGGKSPGTTRTPFQSSSSKIDARMFNRELCP
jgi:hypothetical protein